MADLIPDARCSGCGAPIRWLHTVNSKGTTKPMPVNVRSDREKGNLHVNGEVVAVVPRGQAAGMRAAGIDLYTSHFTECPNAADFRNKQAAKGAHRR